MFLSDFFRRLSVFDSIRTSYFVSFHSFIHQWLYSTLLGPGLFFSFVIFFTQTVGLLGRVISPSQGRYLHTGQHKHRINAHTDIHALSGIRTYDPSVRASEDGSCLTPRGHCDRHFAIFFFFGAITPIWALAYLNATPRFTSVF
jgi:hypothetical protein